jgi:N-acetylglucosamine-6-phosphate deacetylase
MPKIFCNAKLIGERDMIEIPAFVDFQVNGGCGILWNDDPSLEAGNHIMQAHRNFGTAALFLTLITDHPDKMQTVLEAWQNPKDWPEGVIGIHFEGPFISKQKPGVHPTAYIRPLAEKDVEHIIAFQKAIYPKKVMMTLAPECCDLQHIKALSEAGIMLAAGHSNATFDEAIAGFDAGIEGVTHLYNAMSGFTAREPGLIGAALMRNDVWASGVFDGHHMHEASLKHAFACKGDLFFSVSDAMAVSASDQKSFQLNGEEVHREGTKLVNKEGRLAGAAITQLEALQYLVREAGLPIEKAVKAVSMAPRQILAQNSVTLSGEHIQLNRDLYPLEKAS